MAKGNLGNLLQHFIAIRATERLVSACQSVGCKKRITYTDPYAMAPWEPVRSAAPDFARGIDYMRGGAAAGDRFAKAFNDAWSRRSGGIPMPAARAETFRYPNTAVLLRSAFPDQFAEMRLHDKESFQRQELEKWAKEQNDLVIGVEGVWQDSPLLKSNVSRDSPALVMLDPNQIRSDKADCILSTDDLRGLLARHHLDLLGRSGAGDAAPAMVLMFSYSERNPQEVLTLVENFWQELGWTVNHVRADSTSRNFPVAHIGWICTARFPAGVDLQQDWDQWLQQIAAP